MLHVACRHKIDAPCLLRAVGWLDHLVIMFGHSNGCVMYQGTCFIVMTNLHKKRINQIEHVTSYAYLGSLITEDGRSKKELKRRIMIARATFTNMRSLLSCSDISQKISWLQ